MKEEDIVREQIAYYDQRAPEYDDTFRIWREDEPAHQELMDAVERFRPSGRVLDLACGTGAWTEKLVPYADAITGVDASPNMIARARERLSHTHTKFEIADLFEWEPDGLYDVVFFTFWLSHVPSSRFEAFWELVDRALAEDGQVFFIDEAPHAEHQVEYLGDETVRRRLRDGTPHRAVKKYWEPARLEEKLATLGWDVRVTRASRERFYWGAGMRAS